MRSLVPVLLVLLTLQSAYATTRNGFDLEGATIDPDEIKSGGPPRDGIPAINEPVFIAAEKARFIDGDDRVMGVVINGHPRAYPIAILNWHELVNDRVGDQHFTVSYCPLCGTGMVFATNVQDVALVFGVSGLLYNSDMLLYDRNTLSLWSQILGEAISGPLVGTSLPQLPARHTSWRQWQSEHPETKVLSRDTGFRRDYGRSPYRGYEKSRRLYFEVANNAPDTYHRKALVMGVSVDGTHKAYPFEELARNGEARFIDTVNGQRLEIHWDEASRSAWAVSRDGDDYPTTTGFWFAWYAFFPETQVYTAEQDN